jgi:hypothetical protein
MSNLFVKLIRRAEGIAPLGHGPRFSAARDGTIERHPKENVFTECFAATLQEDPKLAKEFLIHLCGKKLDQVQISRASIKTETQQRRDGAYLDMVFTLNGQKLVGVENKLFAPEGKGQLRKYLRLGWLDRLAFISVGDTRIARHVLASPHYLRPRNRPHFRWADFYRLVEQSTHRPSATVFNKALLQLFQHLGFEPPIGPLGDLQHPNPIVRRKNREKFAKRWEATKDSLRRLGWTKFSRGQIAMIGVEQGRSKRLEWASLDPIYHHGSLRLRLTFRKRGYIPGAAELLQSPRFKYRTHVELVQPNIPSRRREPVLDIFIPLRKLFRERDDPEWVSQRLADFAFAVFDLVERARLRST